MSLTLAIDQSTSATKAVLFDASGNAVAKASREHRQIYPLPGHVEHDAEEIWQNLLAVVRELAEKHGDLINKVARFSLTNQRETILIFDRRTGQPLHHALVWQDRRGDAICQQLRDAGHEDAVRAKTGLKIDGYFSASKLKWLIDARPGLAEKIRTGEAVIGTIDAYLIHRLTSGQTFATDHSNASRTLLYDIGRLRWDEELCVLFDVSPNALPQVRESSAVFGETDCGGTLPKSVPIVGVMGDSQAALFTQRCFTPGTAKATFGTGTSVMLNVGDRMPADDGGGAVAALAWVLDGKPTYALEGIINYSAATIAWLKDGLRLIKDADEVEALASAVPDSGGVYFVPAFAGLGAPHWSPDARAAVIGMSSHTRREHVVRAALESIAFQVRDVVDMLRADAGVRLATLNADGGATRNAMLMQFIADLTGAELVVSDVPEASALGATFAGMIGDGTLAGVDAVAALRRQSKTYRPAMPRPDADRLHAGWLAAVKRVL